MLLLSLFLTVTLVSGAGLNGLFGNDGGRHQGLPGLEVLFQGLSVRDGIVRRATNDDYDNLYALDANLYPGQANLYARCKAKVHEEKVWVLENQRKIVGALWIRKAHIFSLNIVHQAGSDEYTHVGKMLMQHLYVQPEYKGMRLTVRVPQASRPLRRLIREVGFKPFKNTNGQIWMACTRADRAAVMPLIKPQPAPKEEEKHEMRPATQADIPELITLDKTVFREEASTPFRKGMNLSGVTIYLVDGVIAACAFVTGRHLQSIGTLKDYRGKKIAKKLMVHVLTTLRARGNTISLNVDQDNEGAVTWYESIGFIITNRDVTRHADVFVDKKARKQYVMTLTKLSNKYQGYVDAFRPFSVAEL